MASQTALLGTGPLGRAGKECILQAASEDCSAAALGRQLGPNGPSSLWWQLGQAGRSLGISVSASPVSASTKPLFVMSFGELIGHLPLESEGAIRPLLLVRVVDWIRPSQRRNSVIVQGGICR